MKKLISLVLVLALVMGLSVAAFADSQTGNPTTETQTMPADQQNTVNIVKTYKLTNADTTSPAETVAFTFKNVKVSDAAAGITVENMPSLVSVALAAYAEGAATTAGSTSNLVVTLPKYTSVGIYEYEITETDGNMAGVKYGANATPIKLVVTITQGADGLLEIAAIHTEGTGETKTDTFTNEYSAGKLEIKKTVSGNGGDQSKYFDFTVTLVAPSGDTVGADIAISGGTNPDNPASIEKGWTGTKTVTLKLKHGETVSLSNIPYGVTYTVDEADYSGDGYSTSGEVTTATAISAATATVTVTNTKTIPVDTGVILESLPYVVIGLVVAAAVVLLIVRKTRKVED